MSPTASQMAPLRGDKRWAYLTRAATIRLASTNDDGSIYLTPLWYVVDDNHVYIPLDAGSRHANNAESGRAVSGLVDSGDEYATVAGVRLAGALSEVTDVDKVERLQGLVGDKYFYVGHPYAEQYFEFGVFAGRRYFEFVTTSMIGWDSRERTMPQVPESRVLPDHVGDRLLADDPA